MAPTTPHPLLAALDLGTSSFKLLLAHPLPTPSHSLPRFLILHRLSHSILLGLSPPLSLPLSALLSFSSFLLPLRPLPLRAIATAALRSSPSLLLSLSHSHLNLPISIISGHREAHLVYLAVLHFLPSHHNKRTLVVDIGGGSTEFALGHHGRLLSSDSLPLGHVTLTQSSNNIHALRSHIRTVLDQSGIGENINTFGYEVAVGTAGTVRAIERAIRGGDFGRKWGFSKEELDCLVERIVGVGESVEGVRRLGFSKKRARFIAAGAVLLAEIFEVLGIGEMEISGYGLGEGVIAEMMMEESGGWDGEFDVEDERWRSAVRLAVRFGGGDGMKSDVECLGIAKVGTIFCGTCI